MRDYSSHSFHELLNNFSCQSVVKTNMQDVDLLHFKYFLTRNYYYASIIDDYCFSINNRSDLLEALYYQLSLITVHSLNWDAFHEGLRDMLNNLAEFDGLCLLFKHKDIELKLSLELKILIDIINDINSYENKKVVIVFNSH